MKKNLSKKQKTSLMYEIIGRVFVRLTLFMVFEYAVTNFLLWAVTRTVIY